MIHLAESVLRYLPFVAPALLLCACAPAGREADTSTSASSPATSSTASSPATASSPGTLPRIEWDPATLSLLQPGGGYGRMIRLRNGDLLCCFERGGKIALRRGHEESPGGRVDWDKPADIASWSHGYLANPDLLQLEDGSILCFYNGRPDNKPAAKDAAGNELPDPDAHPFTIGVVRADASARQWSEPSTLFSAGTTPDVGCWEPTAIQLPSGEVQLYFANESPYRTTHEQEISMMRSHDGGRTWSQPEAVSFRANFRDGMPSPILLREAGSAGQGGDFTTKAQRHKEGQKPSQEATVRDEGTTGIAATGNACGAPTGIALAIEDDGLDGPFKPVIVFTPLDDNWRSGPVRGDSPRRWGALCEPLPKPTYGGAPFLRQLPSGITVLSFQISDGGTLEGAHMAVSLGDSAARDFSPPTYPFPRSPGVVQWWNSLFVKSPDTVTALSTTTINGQGGLWSIDGRIVLDRKP